MYLLNPKFLPARPNQLIPLNEKIMIHPDIRASILVFLYNMNAKIKMIDEIQVSMTNERFGNLQSALTIITGI